MKSPGKAILKVVSILYIVFSGLFAAAGILLVIAWSEFDSLPDGFSGSAGGAISAVLLMICAVCTAANLITGIIGIKFCGNPRMRLFFIILGFILFGLTLTIAVVSLEFWMLAGLAMPGLFIVGGFMNRSASAQAA